MKLTRRNALIGMGTVAAGAGVIGGSGAFTSVQADRSVSVTTEGDTGAALGISPADDGSNLTSNAADYTNATGPNAIDGDTFQITIGGNGAVAGLNVDAVTTIEDLFELVNNSTNEVEVDFQISNIPSEFNSISIIEGSSSTQLETGEGNWVSPVTIDSGSTYSNFFGMEFDITDSAPNSFDLELTIRAEDNS